MRFEKPHNEELHNLYSSPSVFRMIKSRCMQWAVHVARMVAKREAYRVFDVKVRRKEITGEN
jgi:hypothetical protein